VFIIKSLIIKVLGLGGIKVSPCLSVSVFWKRNLS